ncbi:OmpA/MotB family protein [Paeniglutamicibacter cryotolerans]|uniref:Chemotaxis protein MotB n=1 Tax=Paeniglutamicibacter cryotolerans TaxID=670079 RepID=A0A839QIN7_9MICC|nr:flagellar motor protein MotB [Paeniglutamicibacter cryotolerans]MBB2993886.1 chemotaxis protein MotB [Paeniglutamicibacter cryotolerans]
MSSRSRSSRRGRGGGAAGGHDGPDERWMASYMDMVTVLMCLFIVLYAMSTVDQDKFAALKNSLATGFGSVASQNADTAEGIVVPPELIGSEGLLASAELDDKTRETLTALAKSEQDDLLELKERIEGRLEESGHKGAAAFSINQRGLTIRLVSAETFFEPNSATMTANAKQILGAIAPVLAPTDRHFEIEGFADVLTPAAPYPTNWELSASRATRVLRNLVEDGGVKAPRISSVGYGDARPIAGRKNLSLNRRVDVVVLSNQPESVRNLLPGYSG